MATRSAGFSSILTGVKNTKRPVIGTRSFCCNNHLAPTAGLEPATSKLTASCSTIELRRNTRSIIPVIPGVGQVCRGHVLK